MLSDGLVTTQTGTRPVGDGVQEVSICVHSDTPVSHQPFTFSLCSFISQGAVEVAKLVKRLVDESNGAK